MDEAGVIRACERWVRELVVGRGLCPFAALPLEAGRVRFAVCHESGLDAIYRALLGEIDWFVQPPVAADWETGLLIVPHGLEAFDDYLDLLYSAQQVIERVGLEEQLQLASFHPDYRFDGLAEDDPANYSNRSPYPMFHLLRQASVTRALAAFPAPEEIPRRNSEQLRHLGLSCLQQRLARCRR